MAQWMSCELFRGAGSNDKSPTASTFGPQVDYVVSRFNDVDIMFNEDHRVSVVDECVKSIQEPVNIGKMKAGSGFVKKVQGMLGSRPGQMGGQFHTLGFSAGKRA